MAFFDINDFKNPVRKSSRYERQLKRVLDSGKQVDCIEKAVTGAIDNIKSYKSRSFVIYGEPQSGKTEMMIALTAKLLDEGHRIIIVLLNDNVQLLGQNLDRFRRSSISPAPNNFEEILDPSINVNINEWIIFAKKNSKDLQKLINKVGLYHSKVIIDDEADYATPNTKVNKGEKTKINELVGVLLGEDGIYIGVTATPARLDLNNTFKNENQKWVDFPSHVNYTGQTVFFPTTLEKLGNVQFHLNLLPDTGDNPSYLKTALFGFFVNVAYLNLRVNSVEVNYCMLVHTSGKKADHFKDYSQIIKIIGSLKNADDKYFESYIKTIWDIAQKRGMSDEGEIVRYILEQALRSDVVVLNSDRIVEDTTRATAPSVPFTITIGGNIISRGVTFNNLLSMFFTRDVKHKIQQDTYIQRARMFGSRNSYIKYFELTIPAKLYLDWQRCFVFHALSLSAIKAGKGSPVWLEDSRVRPVSTASIDKAIVDMDSGEMVMKMFDYNPSIEAVINNAGKSTFEKLNEIASIVGGDGIYPYLIDFIGALNPVASKSIVIHPVRSVGISTEYHDTLERPRGIFGSEASVKEHPDALHHILVVKNTLNRARVVYKYVGNITMIKKRDRS